MTDKKIMYIENLADKAIEDTHKKISWFDELNGSERITELLGTISNIVNNDSNISSILDKNNIVLSDAKVEAIFLPILAKEAGIKKWQKYSIHHRGK